MIHNHSQQIFSADFLSRSSQQIFSADLLSRSSQQIFSADFVSRSSQQIFSADFLSRSSQQILSRSSQQIFSADLLSRFSQQIFSADFLSRSSHSRSSHSRSSQQIFFSRSSQQIFSADLLIRSSQQFFSADLLSRSSQQIFSADLLSRSSQLSCCQLLSYHVGGQYCTSSLEGPFRGAFGKNEKNQMQAKGRWLHHTDVAHHAKELACLLILQPVRLVTQLWECLAGKTCDIDSNLRGRDEGTGNYNKSAQLNLKHFCRAELMPSLETSPRRDRTGPCRASCS